MMFLRLGTSAISGSFFRTSRLESGRFRTHTRMRSSKEDFEACRGEPARLGIDDSGTPYAFSKFDARLRGDGGAGAEDVCCPVGPVFTAMEVGIWN